MLKMDVFTESAMIFITWLFLLFDLSRRQEHNDKLEFSVGHRKIGYDLVMWYFGNLTWKEAQISL